MVNALQNLAKYFDKEMIVPLQQRFIGRKLIPKNTQLSGKGIGMETVDVWSLARMADATISLGLPTGYEDTADVTKATLQLPILHHPFVLPRRMYETYKMAGIGIESALALEAAYRVQLQEEALILNGWAADGATYGVKGLYQSANNTEGTADDFGTYGNAVAKIALAKAVLETDSIYGPFNLVLNPTQENELLGSFSTTGASEWDQVMKMLKGGEIFSSPTQTAATGMLMATPNKAYFDLVIPQEYKTQLNEDPKLGALSPIHGVVYECMAPRVKQTNAICTLTAI